MHEGEREQGGVRDAEKGELSLGLSKGRVALSVEASIEGDTLFCQRPPLRAHASLPTHQASL